MNLKRPITSEERSALELMLKPTPEFTVFLIVLRCGQSDRENLDRQGASADFIAQFERFNVSNYEDESLREAWLMGFRAEPKSRKKKPEPEPEAP